jgi:RHS repeat-associated protein
MKARARTHTLARHFRLFVSAALAALLCSHAAAQDAKTAARPDRGVNPGGAYSVSDIESVSLQNGNVNLSIPLAALPPIAGGRLSFTVRAFYNSKLWNVVRDELVAPGGTYRTYVVDSPQLNDAVMQTGGGGWSIGGGYAITFDEARDEFDYEIPPPADPADPEAVNELQSLSQNNWYKVTLRTPEGAEHQLSPTGGGFQVYGGVGHPRSYLWGYHTATPDRVGAPVRYDSTDGTFISAVVNPTGHPSGVRWTIFLPDGTQVVNHSNGIQRIRDTNGNSIKIFTDGAGTHYQDEQTGREITVTRDEAWGGGLGRTQVWFRAPGGDLHHVDVNFGQTVVRGKVYSTTDWNPHAAHENGAEFGAPCQRHQEMTAQTLPVVREIVFPATQPGEQGRRFSFGYTSDVTETATTPEVFWQCQGTPQTYTRAASRGTGELSRMVMPTGAAVDYTYGQSSLHSFVGPDGADQWVRESITEKKMTHDGVTEAWGYDIENNGASNFSRVTNPDGSYVTEVFYPFNPDFARSWGGSEERAGLVYRTIQSGLVRTDRHWSFRASLRATGSTGVKPLNAYIDAEYTTLLDAQGNELKTSAKTYEHDHNGNATRLTEYDWFAPPPASQRDHLGVPLGVPAGAAVLRVTETAYHDPAPDAASANYYRARPLTTGVPSILGAVKETSVGASRTRFGYDGQPFGSAPTKGNVTEVSSLDDRGDADASNDRWSASSKTYDQYGNVKTSTDPNANVTEFFYEDATHALPTRVESDPLNGTGKQTTLTAYDFSTGLVKSTTDANGQTTEISYTNHLLGAADPFGRPGLVTGPPVQIDGAWHRRKVFTFYEDAQRRVRAESDLRAEGDRRLKTRETRDALGRVVLAESNEGGADYSISARTVYAAAGRVVMQSLPSRAGDGSTPAGWSRTTTDVLGRVVELATFGGSAVPPAVGTNSAWLGSVRTGYSTNEKTVSDQENKSRTSVANALGRVVKVVEAPGAPGYGFETFYRYDALGNLRRVEQGGQLRHFMYDSLSRLVRAKNPEQEARPEFAVADPLTGNSQWSISFDYDGAGNLVRRSDARGVTAAYGYDGLNRPTTINYTGEAGPATPGVVREYDGAPLGKGRLWKSRTAGAAGVVTTVGGYDALGRPLSQTQQFGSSGVPFAVGVEYGLTAPRKLTYPSGRSVSYDYDDAGRLASFTGNLGGGAPRSYSSGITYDAAGRMKRERFGTDVPLFNKKTYNVAGQLAQVRVGTEHPDQSWWNRGAIINHYSNQSWAGDGTDNNGDLKRQEVYVPLDEQISSHRSTAQFYGYDELNRLKSVEEKLGAEVSFAQTYDYDRWGNRTINAAGTWDTSQTAWDINEMQFDDGELVHSNKLYAPGDLARPESERMMRYDPAGNLTRDGYAGGGARTYDAENRMTSAHFVSGQPQTASYTYDADGRRVKRNVGAAGEVWQVYAPGGELLAEYAAGAQPSQPRKEYGYRSGELLVVAEPGQPGVKLPVSAATASLTWGPHTAEKSTDGDPSTSWIAGGWAPQWLQLDLGQPSSVSRVRLLVNQDPPGNTTHQVWGGPSPGSLTLLGTLSGHTQTGQWLELSAAAQGVRYVRVTTTGSPSWVGWSEAEVYGAGGEPAGPTAGLITHWKLDEGSGQSAADSSPSDNDATLAGPSWTAGNAGSSALSFDGADDRLAASAAPAASDNFTVAFWADPRSAHEIDAEGTSGVGGVSGQKYAFWPTYQPGGDAGAGVSVGTNGVSLYEHGFSHMPATLVYQGQLSGWTHVAVVYENKRPKLYINGTLVKTGAVSQRASVRATAQDLGGNVYGYFDGSLDDVRLYGRALSAGEVSQLTGAGVAAGAGRLEWVVTDQLGTPRMIIDRTGSLSGVKRHDYLPFGEEIGAGVGGRTAGQGYSTGDGPRQKFTQKERDSETGLDYFFARYYAGTHGRFTSCDPVITGEEHIVNPQRWNAYSYVLNSPLGLVDPDGRNGRGQSGAKVIDVFITHRPSERKPHPGANWTGLIEKAKRRGIVLNVYYRTENGNGDSEPTTARMKASLTTPGRTVLVGGHSDASHKVEGVGRAEGAHISTSNGQIGVGGVITGATNENPNATVEPLPDIKAQMLVVSVCDISGGLSAITSKMGAGSTFIYNDAGADGLTSLPSNEMSIFAAANVLINGGTAEQVRQAMQDVVNQRVQDTAPVFGQINRGDQVQLRRPTGQ